MTPKKPKKLKKPYEVPSPESVTDDQLKEIADDPDYPEDHRGYVRTVLESGDPEAIKDAKLGVWAGPLLFDLSDILASENGAIRQVGKMRKIMRAVLERIDHDLVTEDLSPDLIEKYFNAISDDHGKKSYVNPYKGIVEGDMPSLLKFEAMKTVEEQDAFVIDMFKNPSSQKVLVILLVTHLNAYPGFLGRLLAHSDVSEENLKKFVDGLSQKMKTNTGEKKQTMAYQVLNYLIFDSKRRKQIDSCIHKDGIFYPNLRKMKKVHQLDRQFFDGAKFTQ